MLSRWERLQSAIAFAEAGEHATARELLEERRQVLVAVPTGEVVPELAEVALGLCRRVDAGLVVLGTREVLELGRVGLELKRGVARLGIAHREIIFPRLGWRQVEEYVRPRPGVVMVVTAPFGLWGVGLGERDPASRFPCPLVIVPTPASG